MKIYSNNVLSNLTHLSNDKSEATRNWKMKI